MTVIRVRGFHIYKDRHGKMRCYHRKTGIAIDLEQFPIGSVGFLAACAKIQLPSVKASIGTWGQLVEDYQRSPAFTSLRNSTKSFYQYAIDYLIPFNEVALCDIQRSTVIRIRDKALKGRGWHFANSVKTTMGVLFSWAVDRGYMNDNPAKDIKSIPRPKDMPRANRPWTDIERYTVMDECPPQMKIALGLMMYLGLDPIDALTARKSQYDGESFTYVRTKTGESVWRPVPAELKKILKKAKDHDAITLACTVWGKPWTRSGFNSTWEHLKLRLQKEKKIGIGLTLKGLRHTRATIEAEIGVDDRTIGAGLGQKSDAMPRWYSRDADMRKRLTEATKKLDAEEGKRRKKAANLEKKVANPVSVKRRK